MRDISETLKKMPHEDPVSILVFFVFGGSWLCWHFIYFTRLKEIQYHHHYIHFLKIIAYNIIIKITGEIPMVKEEWKILIFKSLKHEWYIF